jgi:hypothetical protein
MDKVMDAVYNDVYSTNRNIWLCLNPTYQLKRNYISATYLIAKKWRRDLGLSEIPTPLRSTPYNKELLECWDMDSGNTVYVAAIRQVRAAMYNGNLPRKPKLGI